MSKYISYFLLCFVVSLFGTVSSVIWLTIDVFFSTFSSSITCKTNSSQFSVYLTLNQKTDLPHDASQSFDQLRRCSLLLQVLFSQLVCTHSGWINPLNEEIPSSKWF